MLAIFVVLAVACVLCLGVTTPTSYFARLTGTETWTDAVNFGTAAHVFGGPVSFTGTGANAPTFSGGAAVAVMPSVLVPAATTTLAVTAALHAGKIILLQSTGGLAITPPAATGTLNLYRYAVITTVSGGNVTIDPKAGAAADVVFGAVYGGTTGATGGTWITSATNSNLITFNGTTTGGLAGTWIEMLDVATNKWLINGSVITSGTAASPFSNH